MSSDLEIALQYIEFVLRWFVGWMVSNPHILILILLIISVTVLTWRWLREVAAPPVLTSARTSLLLIMMLVMCSAWNRMMEAQIKHLSEVLTDAEWKISQGSQHREVLLNKLEMVNMVKKENMTDDSSTNKDEENPLDNCLHVFIDLGSNRGLQIRKLYEPHHFPLAPILPLYEKFFGKPENRKLQEICSVAFEPNPKHAEHLNILASSYATCGIKVVVYMAGVGHKNSKSKFAPFNSLLGAEVGHDTSARLIHEDESVKQYTESHFHDSVDLVEVDVVRFATFVTEVVAKRKLPTSAGVHKPRVVIKADIEGAELKIIPDMVVTGALNHVDNIHMEWHDESSYRTGREPQMISKLAPAITTLAKLTQSEGLEHQFEIEEMDDETYCGLLIYKPWGDYSEILPNPSC